jgi:hypothetical protein
MSAEEIATVNNMLAWFDKASEAHSRPLMRQLLDNAAFWFAHAPSYEFASCMEQLGAKIDKWLDENTENISHV